MYGTNNLQINKYIYISFFKYNNNNNGLEIVVHKSGRHPSLRHCYQDQLKVWTILILQFFVTCINI